LGSRQRGARFEANFPRLRRATTGTAAFVEKTALVHALALPRVDALLGDATPRTLLNRNVRGFLRGYRGLGIKANWGGREYFRAGARPLGLLAYDLLADGAVIVEAWVGLEATAVVAGSGTEQPGAALCELVTSVDPEHVAGVVARGLADKYGRTAESFAGDTASFDSRRAGPRQEIADEAANFVELPVPIGRLEAAIESGPCALLRGDVLSSNAALDAVEERARGALASAEAFSVRVIEPLRAAPLDGALPEDVLAVLELARR
jgi:hypothetical protein